jgi:Flp pilus assembly protein TadD
VTRAYTSGMTNAPTVRHPAVVLVEDADPTARAAAHLELGRRAVARRELDLAQTHFQHATDLDPTDERPRSELRDLAPAEVAAPRRRFLRWW